MNWNRPTTTRLIQAVLALKTADEARRFLRDLMTEKEIEEFAKRLQAAELLAQKVTYSTVEKKTGLSSATVARVAKWLRGNAGGYRTIIAKLHHHNSIPAGRGLF